MADPLAWTKASISQGYGPTGEKLDSGYKGYANFNKGIDFEVGIGTPIGAAVGGTVIAVGDQGDGWGTSVKVRDAQGNIHNYGHLDGVSVAVGQTVGRGTVVGQSGNTGKSTGPHLSYDVFGAQAGEYIEPSAFVWDGGNQNTQAVTQMIPNNNYVGALPTGGSVYYDSNNRVYRYGSDATGWRTSTTDPRGAGGGGQQGGEQPPRPGMIKFGNGWLDPENPVDRGLLKAAGMLDDEEKSSNSERLITNADGSQDIVVLGPDKTPIARYTVRGPDAVAPSAVRYWQDPNTGNVYELGPDGRPAALFSSPADEPADKVADIRVQRSDGSIEIYDGTTFALKSVIPADPNYKAPSEEADYYIQQTGDGGVRAINKVTGAVMWSQPGTKQPGATSSGALRNSPIVEAAQAALLAQQAAALRTQSQQAAAQAELEGDYVRAQIARMEAQTAAEQERMAIDKAKTYAELLNSVDFGALQAFLGAGGGSVANAIGAGANMLTDQSLSPAAALVDAQGNAPSAPGSPSPVGGTGGGGTPGTGGGATGGSGGTGAGGRSIGVENWYEKNPNAAAMYMGFKQRQPGGTPGPLAGTMQETFDTAQILSQYGGLSQDAAIRTARYADPAYAAKQDAFYENDMARQAAQPPLQSAAQKAAAAAAAPAQVAAMAANPDQAISTGYPEPQLQPQAVAPMLADGGMAKDMAIVGDPQVGNVANPELVRVVGPADAVQRVAIQAQPVQMQGFRRAMPPPQMAALPMLATGGTSTGRLTGFQRARQNTMASMATTRPDGTARASFTYRGFRPQGGGTTVTPGGPGPESGPSGQLPDSPAPAQGGGGMTNWTPAGIRGPMNGTSPVSTTSPMIPGISQNQIDRSLLDRTNAPRTGLNIWGTDWDNADPLTRSMALMNDYQKHLGIPAEVVEYQRARRALRPFAGMGRTVGY